MSKKSIIIAVILVIVVVVTTGYIIYQNVTGEVVVKEDKASVFLNDLKEKTGLEFSSLKETEFSWMIEKDKKISEMSVKGKEIEVKGILNNHFINIQSYLNDDFKLSLNNIATGTIMSLIGYRKDDIVCIVVNRLCFEDSCSITENFPENSETDIVIKCGYLDKSAEPISFGEILEHEMEVEEGQDFLILLDSNLTTGYQWMPEFDYSYIELTEIEYIEGDSAVGSEGKEEFKFKALRKGEMKIVFTYFRAWVEKGPINKVIFKVDIK